MCDCANDDLKLAKDKIQRHISTQLLKKYET